MKLSHQFILYLCLILLSQIGCNKSQSSSVISLASGSPSPSQAALQNNAPSKPPEYPELELFDEMADEAKDSAPLDYNGFQIRRKTKKVLIEETTKRAELSYAQILSKKKVLMTFDGVDHPLGNETRFGLFSFLSPGSKQVFVQQRAWRESRQWLVSLDSHPKILMDSREYQLESFRAIDLDQDKQFELIGYQRYWHFEFLKGLTFSSADSPDIRIVFAYNSKSQAYEPANPRFKSFLLERIEKVKAQFEETDSEGQKGYSLIERMSDVMDATMTLALVGEENAAWDFFDRYCPAATPGEKEDAKSRIKSAIRENMIYKILKRTHQI